MIQPHLARLILRVNDPDRLSKWYCQAFSWSEKLRVNDAGWIEIDAKGFTLALHSGSDETAGYWPKIQVAVDDVSEFRDKLMQQGIEMGEIQTWEHLEWSECSDPEGNTVQICNL